MQLSHEFPVRSMVFDDPNLIADAGLARRPGWPVGPGLIEVAREHLPDGAGGAGHAAGLTVSALVAGMVEGADSNADMAALRD